MADLPRHRAVHLRPDRLVATRAASVAGERLRGVYYAASLMTNRAASLPIPPDLRAIIFDKDGTLVDFHNTWDAALARTLESVLGHDPVAKAALAEGIGFDLQTGVIADGASFVSDSADMLFGKISPHVDPHLFEVTLTAESANSAHPSAGASETIAELRSMGLKIGVATNDSEHSALAQLDDLGWAGLFDTVVGYDSGYTSKPSPKMILGCCAQLGVLPKQALMVGDTATDMRAARSAGVACIAIGPDPSAISLSDHKISNLGELMGLISAS